MTKDILDQINGENFYLTTTLSSNDSGKWKESNFYWLAKTRDQLDYDKSLWYVTPLKLGKGNCANYQQMLTTLREKPAILDVSCQNITNQQWTVTLKNASRHFAFFTELSLISGDDNQWLTPIYWQDNYVSLASGEERKISVKALGEAVIGAKNYTLKAKAWNAQAETECL